MSKEKKNIMSKTEALLAEMSNKLDKLIEVEIYISSLMEADIKADIKVAEELATLMPAVVKPKVEAPRSP